jgi:hypothetical protein
MVSAKLKIIAIVLVLFMPTQILAAKGGWLFMVPPIDRETFEVEASAPLGRWSILERFDTAEDCEQELSQIVAHVHDRTWLAEKEKEYKRLSPGAPLRSGTSELVRKTFEAAKCIRTNDPRLEEKGSPGLSPYLRKPSCRFGCLRATQSIRKATGRIYRMCVLERMRPPITLMVAEPRRPRMKPPGGRRECAAPLECPELRPPVVSTSAYYSNTKNKAPLWRFR